MATLNAAMTLEQANDFASDFAGATLHILDDATLLVSHTVTTWATANDVNNATATATFANDGIETIVADGTATNAVLISATGDRRVEVFSDVTFSSTNFVDGQDHELTDFVITFPAA